jgi:uncharacterized glyoxalase superfamily protein PhnB
MPAPEQFPNSVMLTCNDAKKSVDFYRDVLGFELKECWPDAEKPLWASLNYDKQTIMLGACMDPDPSMCGPGEEDHLEWWKERTDFFRGNGAGAGVYFYIQVDDIDQYTATVQDRGAPITRPVKSQFYGIRDVVVTDPDGYQLMFYSTITMSSCQSCGMPLQDAQPGQMYCGHCTDDNGKLRPYEDVLEGTISGYFMGMQKMERVAAEQAAKEHLAKMPAWVATQT